NERVFFAYAFCLLYINLTTDTSDNEDYVLYSDSGRKRSFDDESHSIHFWEFFSSTSFLPVRQNPSTGICQVVWQRVQREYPLRWLVHQRRLKQQHLSFSFQHLQVSLTHLLFWVYRLDNRQ